MKTKTKMLGALVFVLALFCEDNASAFDNPDESDIFWQTLSAMDNPNDADGCKGKIDDLWESGELVAYDVSNRRAQGQTVNDSELTDRSEEHRISLTAGYYNTCENFDQGFEIMRNSMEQYGKTSNIWDMTDWHNVTGLYFQSQEGKIYFERTLDFMSYRFQIFMQEFPNLVSMQNGYISLNAAMVPELKNYGAVLTMYNLSFSSIPDIYVDGVLANSSDLGAVYDTSTGTLTFAASHFSSYKAVAKGSKQSVMKITGTNKKSIKYKANKQTFKIKVKGRSLKSAGASTTCKLGFNDAMKVSVAKKGKRVTCTFRMSDFSSLGVYPLTVSITGKGEVTRENAVRIR